MAVALRIRLWATGQVIFETETDSPHYAALTEGANAVFDWPPVGLVSANILVSSLVRHPRVRPVVIEVDEPALYKYPEHICRGTDG